MEPIAVGENELWCPQNYRSARVTPRPLAISGKSVGIVLTLLENWPKFFLPIDIEPWILPYGEVLRRTKEISACLAVSGWSDSQTTPPCYLYSPLSPASVPPCITPSQQLMLSAILCPKLSAVKGRVLKPAALLAFQQLKEHKSGPLSLLRLAPVVTWFWQKPSGADAQL